jgi:hypothetical protein
LSHFIPGNTLALGQYTNGLGYQFPATSQPYQIYIVKLQARGINVYGLGLDRTPGVTLPPGVIFLDQNYTPTLQALAAHEYFHFIQWSYQQSCMTSVPGYTLQIPSNWHFQEDLRWWMEATAQWAQHESIPSDKSYAGPVKNYSAKPWQYLYFRPEATDPDNYAYSVLFPFYLIEHSGAGNSGKDIVKATWEQYQDTGSCGAMLPVLDMVLQIQTQLGSVTQIFPDYIGSCSRG